MLYIFIPLGYDWIEEGVSGTGTKARCDVMLEYREKNFIPPSRCHFILTADRPHGSTHKPMAEEMAEYISSKSKGVFCPTPQPQGWGTVSEIRNSISLIETIDKEDSPIRVHISTNPGHMLRVKMYWWVLAPPKDWEVVFIKANHSFSKKEWLQETAKVLRDVYRIATGKIKRTAT